MRKRKNKEKAKETFWSSDSEGESSDWSIEISRDCQRIKPNFDEQFEEMNISKSKKQKSLEKESKDCEFQNIFGGRIDPPSPVSQSKTPIGSKRLSQKEEQKFQKLDRNSLTMPTCIRDKRKKARLIFQQNKETDLYMLLGVDSKATQEDIKKAYRKKCLKFHPDKAKHQWQREMFLVIKNAYKILVIPDQRIIYDESGIEALKLHIDFCQQLSFEDNIGNTLALEIS